MMQSVTLFLLVLLPAAALSGGRQGGSLVVSSISNANPIRKVVTMLQSMSKKVEAEGAREKVLFDKFMCYCKNSGGDLQKSIANANTKAPALVADIEAGVAKKKQLTEDLKQHQTDRSAAKEAMAEAKSLRDKDFKAFTKESNTKTLDIRALSGAIKSISNGMAGGFLQTRGAQILRRLVTVKQDMLEADRTDIMAFLSSSSSSGYAPQSGQITGILKELHDEMSRDLADATAAEKTSVAGFDGLMAAKTREVNALSKAIETKITKNGELAVSIVQMKNDLDDTSAGLLEDQKFLGDMDKNCALKSKEWDERSKTRSEELLAISETIKILNDDDALEMFKKTLPGSASFVQVKGSSSAVRARALEILSRIQTHSKDPRLDFISVCMRGQKGGFEKVIKMVDDMVASLKQEQLDDDRKKEYCAKQFDMSDDKKKALEQNIEDLETSITEAEDGVATSTSEIKALKESVSNLDKAVATATAQRKAEHDEFSELMASNSAAKDILKFAINRLNEFYNPKLHKPAKQAAMTQVHTHAAPPPPPATFGGEYQKKGEESGGVIAMVNLLVKDLDKEMTEAETSEEDSQKDYEQLMQDSAEKRSESKKSLLEKESAKAAMQGELEASKEEKASTSKELMATKQYISSLHSECDWLMKFFDMRKTARADEVDALGKAKAVLNGADYSLLQKGSRNLRSHL